MVEAPKGEGAVELLVDDVFLKPNENGEAVEAAAALGASVVDEAVELRLPPDENDDFGVSADLLSPADEDVATPLAPNEDEVFDAWLGDDAGVVENGLLVSDPLPHMH